MIGYFFSFLVFLGRLISLFDVFDVIDDQVENPKEQQ